MMGRAISADQRAKFIKQLEKTPNVTLAARKAGFNPRTAYETRARDPEFAEEWEDALAISVETLAAAVQDRCLKGIPTRVFNPKTGEMFIERKFQDNISLGLLKVHDKRFREASNPTAGDDVPKELQPDPKPTPDEADAPEPIE